MTGISRARLADKALHQTDLLVRLVLIALMLVPAVVVVVLSFSNETSLVFPPHTWGLRQYRTLFGTGFWTSAAGKSFTIGLAVGLIDLAVGVPAAYAVSRTKLPGRGLLRTIGLAPLIIPGVAYAVAMYTFFVQVHLVGKELGLILAYVVISIPFVIIIITAALARIPSELELVAMTLGASRTRAATGITLRLLVPAICAAFIFSFITSFDEATFINFIGGPGLVTLPKAIFDSLRTGLDPVITAIATILMVLTGLVMTLASYLRAGRRSG
jgi:ABC-type spermidine/putrescine transport system permease subunit II